MITKPIKSEYLKDSNQFNYNECLNNYYDALEKYVKYLEVLIKELKEIK